MSCDVQQQCPLGVWATSPAAPCASWQWAIFHSTAAGKAPAAAGGRRRRGEEGRTSRDQEEDQEEWAPGVASQAGWATGAGRWNALSQAKVGGHPEAPHPPTAATAPRKTSW